jgi:hypothetical protein
MDMDLVVRRLTRPRATTTATFLGICRNYPFTSGGKEQSFRDFVDIAISVCGGGHAAQKRDALNLLAGWVPNRSRVHIDGFPFLNADQLVYQLVLRVLEPRLINQGAYGLCGPAAFIVLLAKSDPKRYIRIAIELLTEGRSSLGAMKIAPNKVVRSHRPDPSTPDADWLTLASLRSSDDALTEGTSTGEYGGTTYGSMMEWLRRAGYGVILGASAPHLTGKLKTFSHLPLIHQIDSWLTCEFHPGKPSFLNGIDLTWITDQAFNLFLADRFVKNHWKVFLMVSEKYTQTSGDEDPIEKSLAPMRALNAPNLDQMRESLITQMVGNRCNHWILVKEIHLSQDTVRITRYSWGAKATTAPISRELFYKIYGGFIAVSELDVQSAVANWHW